MPYSLALHADARNDLRALLQQQVPDAGRIAAVLEEIKNDQRLLDRLTEHRAGERDTALPFTVSRWEEQWQQRRNLWRLKIRADEWHFSIYRVVYAFDPRCHRYYVLGVVHRDFDYNQNDSRTQRILAAYETLDLPVY